VTVPGTASSQPRPRTNAYAKKNGTAPSARLTCPDSGIAVIAAAAQNGLRFSTASSESGRKSEIGPSRWPVLCTTRYGASANASPPTNAAPRGSPTARSHAHAATPAAVYVSSVKMFHASTAPNAANRGQYGSPKTSPAKFARGEISGWKLYGSSHGARRCSSWWPKSQKFQPVCR